MTWGPIEPVDSIESRLRLDFGLRSAILRFNEWAVPGLGGAFFVRQLSWACMGLRLAQELDGRASAARIAEGLEALASWIVVRQSKAARVEDDRVQGKRKFSDIAGLSFDAVSRRGAYVTVPFRRATTRALPGIGFCHEEARFNELTLTQQGLELAESAMAETDMRMRLIEWLRTGTTEIQRVSEAMKATLLPEFASDQERRIVHRQVLAHEGRRAIRDLLHRISIEQLAGTEGRESFLGGMADPVLRKRLAICFAFEDLRTTSLIAAQQVNDEIRVGARTATVLAAQPDIGEHFKLLAAEASSLRKLLPEDAPAEAVEFCSEQSASTPLETRILTLCSRVPMIFSVIGDLVDHVSSEPRELIADDPSGAPGQRQIAGLPVPRPILRLRRLLEESGERFDNVY